jgi:hypothetical protein
MSIAPAPSPLPATPHQDHKPLLTTDKLVKIYGGRTVVRGVNLDVASGEWQGPDEADTIWLEDVGARKPR